MITAQHSMLRAPDFRHRPGRVTAPWNIKLTGANTFGGTNVFSALPAGVASWGGNAYPVYYATISDPVVSVLYCATSFTNTNNGTWTRTGNSGTLETNIRAASVNAFDTSPNGNASRFNYQSTSTSSWVLPALAVTPNPTGGGALQVRRPTGANPCPDSDGHMAIYQPNGTVLETYATIILSDGTIVCGNANETDPGGLLDGLEGGMTAACLPNYVGLIKQTDLNAGVIAHAIALAIPATQLTATVVYPAATFDRSTTYSGTFGMGTHFAIPQSVNLALRTWESVEGHAIGIAAQNYGCYAVDTGGSGITLRCEMAITNAEFVDAPGSPDYFLFDDVTYVVHNLQKVTG
jgi:hypothetical protein